MEQKKLQCIPQKQQKNIWHSDWTDCKQFDWSQGWQFKMEMIKFHQVNISGI